MILLTEFTILIERRRLRERLIGVGIAAAVVLSALFGARAALAQPPGAVRADKVARDLREGLSAQTLRGAQKYWARDRNGTREVQAVFVTDGSDTDMSGLRAQVLRLGGSVHGFHRAVQALTVQIDAKHINGLAHRNEVVSVSPNRPVRRTASTLE